MRESYYQLVRSYLLTFCHHCDSITAALVDPSPKGIVPTYPAVSLLTAGMKLTSIQSYTHGVTRSTVVAESPQAHLQWLNLTSPFRSRLTTIKVPGVYILYDIR